MTDVILSLLYSLTFSSSLSLFYSLSSPLFLSLLSVLYFLFLYSLSSTLSFSTLSHILSHSFSSTLSLLLSLSSTPSLSSCKSCRATATLQVLRERIPTFEQNVLTRFYQDETRKSRFEPFIDCTILITFLFQISIRMRFINNGKKNKNVSIPGTNIFNFVTILLYTFETTMPSYFGEKAIDRLLLCEYLHRICLLNLRLLIEMNFFSKTAEMARVYGIQFEEVRFLWRVLED